MAVGGEDGNVSMLELSQSLSEVNRQDKLATSEMFERETRREKILEAIELNREMQLRQKNKSGLLNVLSGGKKDIFCPTERKETEEKKKVDPLDEAEKEFYRIINEVKVFHLQNATRIFAFHLGRCCCHLILLTNLPVNSHFIYCRPNRTADIKRPTSTLTTFKPPLNGE